jgi:prepilin-type N-terminal cleavage/methylation domain-containing protein
VTVPHATRPSYAGKSAAGLTLIELMIVVAIIGALAGVAIPVFSRYLRRAKTGEVYISLSRIVTGAKTYFTVEHTDSNGLLKPRQFPLPEVYTPTVTCCSRPGNKCDGGLGAWTSETWQALHFAIENDHYYRYSFDSSGINMGAVFTARAEGNLDCDSVTAHFRTTCSVDDELTAKISPVIPDDPDTEIE